MLLALSVTTEVTLTPYSSSDFFVSVFNTMNKYSEVCDSPIVSIVFVKNTPASVIIDIPMTGSLVIVDHPSNARVALQFEIFPSLSLARTAHPVLVQLLFF